MRTILSLLAALAAGCSTEPDYDLVLRNGTLFDGSGRPSFQGDLAFAGDRIAAIGRLGGKGAAEIDLSGLYVAPGFIDMHSHSEDGRLAHEGRGPSFALQGFTTEIYGETTSMGPVGGKQEDGLPESLKGKWTTLGEFLTYMEETGIDINVASYVGSGGIRAHVMGYQDRPPTESELEEMKALVRQAMKEGAFGVSAGMSYVPNIYMSTDELVALVKEAAAVGGIYANHARTMNGTDPNAIREGVEIAEKAGAALHFFHLNSLSSTRASEFLALIDEARDRGIRISGDSYTYTWGITGLSDYIPAWAQEGGREAMLTRLRDPETRKRIAQDFVDEPPYLANIGWHHVRLGVDDPDANGKLVEELSEIREMPPEDVFMDVVLKAEGRGIVIDWNNEEDTLRQVLLEPYVAIGTDGGALDLEWKDLPPLVHPRHLGTAPRFLGTYVREEKLLSWEEAIRKLTSLPADILGIEGRGMLKPGQFADVAVFDPNEIAGKATFEDPFHYSVGVRHLFVNGVAVVKDSKYTGERPGKALRGPGYQP
jgi:N-acyl-D-amino-acid deacylase